MVNGNQNQEPTEGWIQNHRKISKSQLIQLTWMYVCPKTSGHAPDETGCGVLASDALMHNVPQVLNWIEIWGTWRPVHGINACVIQELPTHSGHMRPGGLLHLSPGISSTLLRLCWEAQQAFLRWLVWICHPGGFGWPVQPHARDKGTNNAKLEKNSQEELGERNGLCCCLSCPPVVSFICTKWGEVDSELLMLPNWPDQYLRSLTVFVLYCDD